MPGTSRLDQVQRSYSTKLFPIKIIEINSASGPKLLSGMERT